jgi:hypothetical protein
MFLPIQKLEVFLRVDNKMTRNVLGGRASDQSSGI